MAERLEVIITADDRASSVLHGVSGSIASLGGAAVLGGIAAAAVGLVALSGAGIQAVSSFERLSAVLTALSAREIQAADTTLSMADALELAAPAAQELLSWIQQVAIQSPFTAEALANVVRTLMNFGLASDAARDLTQTLVDFTAATGGTEAQMNQIALALGQIQARGRLAGQELMQLVNAGVPAMQLLAEHFGVTTAEVQEMVEAGLIPADEAIAAITEGMDAFEGSAARMATSLMGLGSSFADVGQLALRAIFTPALEALQPVLADTLNLLLETGIPALEQFGQGLGRATERVIEWARGTDAGHRALQLLGEALATGDWDAFSSFTTAMGMLTPDQIATLQNLGVALKNLGEIVVGVGDGLQTFGEHFSAAFDSVWSAAERAEDLNNLSLALANFMAVVTDTEPAQWESFNLSMANLGDSLGILSGLTLEGITGQLTGIFQLLSGDQASAVGTTTQLTLELVAGLDRLARSLGAPIDSAPISSALQNIGLSLSGVVAIVDNAANGITNLSGAFAGAGQSISNAFMDGIAPIMAVVGFVSSVIDQALGIVRAASGPFAGAGSALGEGLVAGAIGALQGLIGAITAIIQAAIAAAYAAADAASPSREMMRLGEFLMQGLAVGIDDTSGLPATAGANAIGGIGGAVPALAGMGAGGAGFGAGGLVVIFNYYDQSMFSMADEEVFVEKLAPPLLRILQERTTLGAEVTG